ncbi:MAG: hypothetical protein E7256_03245 [Lachnospiraceae bacterium]|nr:hypothetical protein [Lachnospiraceae bacterium]
MLEALKKKARKNTFTQIAIALAISIGSLIVSNFAIFTYLKGPVTFVPGADYADYEGKYVTYDVEYVLSDFMSYSTVNTKTNVETLKTLSYIVYDDADFWFFGAEFDKDMQDTLDAQMDETVDWLYGDIDQVSNKITVTGTFTKLEGEALTYYNETVAEIGEALEYDYSDIAMPYYIRDGRVGNTDIAGVYVYAALHVIPLIYAIYLAIRFLSGSYDKNLKKFVAANPRISMEQIEADFGSAEQVSKNVWVGRRFTLYTSGIYACILDNRKLVWAYYYKRTGKRAESMVRTFDINHKQMNINCSEAAADLILKNYASNQPHMVVGYSKEQENVYRKDFQTFLTYKYNDAVAAASEDPFQAYE